MVEDLVLRGFNDLLATLDSLLQCKNNYRSVNSTWPNDCDYIWSQKLPPEKWTTVEQFSRLISFLTTLIEWLRSSGLLCLVCLCLVMLRSERHVELLTWHWKNQVRTSFFPSFFLAACPHHPARPNCLQITARVLINTSCILERRSKKRMEEKAEEGWSLRSTWGYTWICYCVEPVLKRSVNNSPWPLHVCG